MKELFIKTQGNKNNQTIIFLHGFPFNHQLWEEQVKELKENYYCVSFDIRGLGKSEVGNGQHTLEKYSEDLIQLVKFYKLDKPILCGMSMGGYILLRSVEKEHDLFGGIVLINTKSETDNNFVKLKRGEGIDKIDSEGLKKFNREFITPLFSQKTIKNNTKLIDKIIRRANQSNPIGVKAALLAMAGRTDTTESLAKITLPTLVLCGKQDKLTPPEVMEEMAGKIAGAEFFTIPAAAHMAPVENSSFVNKKIKSFIKKIG